MRSLNQDLQDFRIHRMRSPSQDERIAWITSRQKPYTPKPAFCLTFLMRYVFMFCNNHCAALLRTIPLATELLYCIRVSVEHILSEDFVNFVTGKP